MSTRLVAEVRDAFLAVLENPLLCDDQIRDLQDPMAVDSAIPLLSVVPCFMLHCAKYPEENSLVAYHTVNAIAEYGRSKDPENHYLNFKFQCSKKQRKTVRTFLIWAKGTPLSEDEEQINRALKRWI